MTEDAETTLIETLNGNAEANGKTETATELDGLLPAILDRGFKGEL